MNHISTEMIGKDQFQDDADLLVSAFFSFSLLAARSGL